MIVVKYTAECTNRKWNI